MTFDRNRWSRNTDAMNTGAVTVDGTVYNGPAMFTYASASDNLATIAGANYFAAAVYDLAAGDYIWTAGTDGNQVLTVSAVDRTAGTISTATADLGTVNSNVLVASSELLALATTPKELVAAPGAGLVNVFFGAQFILNYGTSAYTEAGDNMGIKYTDASGVQVSSTVECTGFIDQTADTITSAVAVGDAIVAATGAVNQALVLDNLGSNFAAGDGTMNVNVTYKVIPSGL